MFLDGEFQATVTVSEWSLNQTLNFDVHYWHVVASNAAGSTSGPTWIFGLAALDSPARIVGYAFRRFPEFFVTTEVFIERIGPTGGTSGIEIGTGIPTWVVIHAGIQTVTLGVTLEKSPASSPACAQMIKCLYWTGDMLPMTLISLVRTGSNL